MILPNPRIAAVLALTLFSTSIIHSAPAHAGLLRKLEVAGAIGAELYVADQELIAAELEIDAAVQLAADTAGTAEANRAYDRLEAVLRQHPIRGPAAVADAIAHYALQVPVVQGQSIGMAKQLGLSDALMARQGDAASEQEIRAAAHVAAVRQAMENGTLISDKDQRCMTGDLLFEGVDAMSAGEEAILGTSETRRSGRGVPTGGEDLPYVGVGGPPWFYNGAFMSYALIPGQVAAVLRARHQGYASFDSFRAALWRTIVKDAALVAVGEFTGNDVKAMRRGQAPLARGQPARRYEIHHLMPIKDYGAVYNMDNMLIVDPVCHRRIHDVIESSARSLRYK